MTQFEAAVLHDGDKVVQSIGVVRHRGVIDTSLDHSVGIRWTHAKRLDVLSRTSPLWRTIELDK